MKKLLLILSLIALSSLTRASDVELIQQTATDVYNLKIGETSTPVSVAGLSVLDQQGNRSVVSLGDSISLQTAGVQLSGVLFAIVPPDTNGDPVTALIVWQATAVLDRRFLESAGVKRTRGLRRRWLNLSVKNTFPLPRGGETPGRPCVRTAA
jgi:hypothetical protein